MKIAVCVKQVPDAAVHKRIDPSTINGSRRLRIANGSGSTTSEVNQLLKQFKEMQRMMGQMGLGARMKKNKKGKKGGRVTVPAQRRL